MISNNGLQLSYWTISISSFKIFQNFHLLEVAVVQRKKLLERFQQRLTPNTNLKKKILHFRYKNHVFGFFYRKYRYCNSPPVKNITGIRFPSIFKMTLFVERCSVSPGAMASNITLCTPLAAQFISFN